MRDAGPCQARPWRRTIGLLGVDLVSIVRRVGLALGKVWGKYQGGMLTTLNSGGEAAKKLAPVMGTPGISESCIRVKCGIS